jgi:hypothetical protein
MAVGRQRICIIECKLQEALIEGLVESAKLFFYDSDVVWPLCYSTFYLGHVPHLSSLLPSDIFATSTICVCFLYNVHSDFHIASIRLTSCIWGMVQRDMAKMRVGTHLIRKRD